MASVSDDPISLWLKLGALDKLEQALLDGYGEQLLGKTSRIPQVARFLKQVPMLQAQIEQIHEDTMQGKLDEIRSLLGSRQLAFCRDQQGASPLHKAVLFQQRNMVTFFVENFPGVMHARDHQGRTPLHYAAVLQDNWEIYNMLKAAGSDENATDVYGHTPDFYLEAPGELTVEQLKEGVSTPRSKKSKHRRKKSGENATGATFRGYSAKPAGLKVQIREVIAQGNLEALEELVLHGHGDKLLGEISPNPVVQEFLDTVPGYMEQINDVHRAVVRGRLREVQTLMNHKSLSLARDSLGATPIHKAIMHGHHEIVQHLAENFVQCLSAKDLEGRTPLHYASAMKDGRKMYNMLLLAGSPTTIVDSKGKTAEYYLQYPDKLNMEQIIKRNQLANATYLGNTISRLKTLAPSFQKTIVNMHERYHLTNAPPNGNQEGFFNGDEENRSEGSEEAGDDKTAAIASQAEALKKVMMRSKPILPPVILPRLEVTSANIRKWIDEHDLKKLEGAVFEGYGERLARETSTGHQEVEQYLRKDVPRMLERIQAIHRAVADDDVPGLESQLDSADYALARDRMGMTPLHRAVVLGRQDAVKLLVDKFPETINARDREGRTALHYAAAASRRSGRSHLYRLLLQNGSDPRIRDNRGKSSEFYKTHHLPMPPEIGQLGPSAKDKARSRSEPPGSRPRKHSVATSLVAEKLSSALQKGDPGDIRELVLEGHGRHLLGRTSWNEEVRQLLKALPTHLQNVNATHEAISRGDVAKLKELAALDETYLKTRSEDGCHPIHAAIENRQLEAVRLILEKFPACINLKASHGRNPLHLAALRRDTAIYKLLVECGADPKALDQKGKTAEYYLKSRRGRSKSSASPNPPRERSPPKEKPFSSKTTKVETIAVPTMEKETLSSSSDLQRPRENVEEKHENDRKAVPNREDANAEQNATADDGNSPEESDSGDAEGKQPHDVPSNSDSRSTDIDVGEIVSGNDPAVADVTSAVDDSVRVSEPDVRNGDGIGDNKPKVDDVADRSACSVEENGGKKSDDLEGCNSAAESAMKDGKPSTGDEKQQENVMQKFNGDGKPSQGNTEEADYSSKAVTTPLKSQDIVDVDATSSNLDLNSKAKEEETSELHSSTQSTPDVISQKGTSDSPEETQGQVDKMQDISSIAVPPDGMHTVNVGQTKDEEPETGDSNLKCDTRPDKEDTLSSTDEGPAQRDLNSYNNITGEAQISGEADAADISKSCETHNSDETYTTEASKPSFSLQQENQIENESTAQIVNHDTALKSTSEYPSTLGEANDLLKNEVQENPGIEKNDTASSKPVVPSRRNNVKANSASSKPHSNKKSDQVKQLNNKEKATQLARRSTQIVSKALNSTPATKKSRNEKSNVSAMNPRITPFVELSVNGEVPKTPSEEDGDHTQESQENEHEAARVGKNSRATEAKNTGMKTETFSGTKDKIHEPNKAHLRSVPEEQPETQHEKQDADASANGDEKQPKSNALVTADPKEQENGNDNIDDSDNIVSGLDFNKDRPFEKDNAANIEKAREKKLTILEPEHKHATSTKDTQNLEFSNDACKETGKDADNQNENSTLNDKAKPANDTTKCVSASEPRHSTEAANPTSEQTSINDVSHKKDEGRGERPSSGKGADQLPSSRTTLSSRTKKTPSDKDPDDSVAKAAVPTETYKDHLEGPPQVQARTSGSTKVHDDLVEASDGDQATTEETKTKQEDVKRQRRASSSNADKEKHVQYKGSKLSSSTAMQLDRLNELIDLWIKDGDLLRLEHVVIAGQGERLLNKTSEDKQVQEFLSLVPAYMERIRSVHEAVVRGNLAEVRQVLTRKRFALSRDHLGASPLHLAVLHGHTDVLNYIVDKFPETLDGPDNEGRTPLHYAAVVMEAQNYFDILKKAGADDTIKDKMGHTPEFYVKNPKELTIRDLLESYQTTNDEEKSATADVWKRPPTPPEDAEAEGTPAVEAQPDAPVVSEAKSVPASVPDQDKKTDQKQAPSKEPGKVQAPVEKPVEASVHEHKPKLPAQVLPSAPPLQESVKEEIQEKVKGPLPESTKMPKNLPSEALKHEPAKGKDSETTEVLVLAPPAPAQDPRPAQEKEPLIVPVVLPTKALSKVNQVPVQEPPLVPGKVESQALQPAKLRPTAEEAAQVQGPTQLPEKVPQAEAHLPETPRAHAPSTREVLKSAEVRQLAQSMLREGRTVEEGRYLTDAVGDVLSRGLLAVSKQRPADPVNFLVSWLKEQVPQKPAPVAKALPDPSTVTKERSISSRSNTNSSSATSEGSLKKAGFAQPFTEDVVDEDAEHYRDDHTKLKDEEGQTVLHFAASHSHSEGCFYALIRQGHVLLAERDGRYRTARDVAREASQRDNLLDLDQYVLDAFLERRSDLLRALAHQGYDQLLNAVDKHGRDVTSIVTQFEMTDMQSLMHELAYFFKARDELHAFVRNGYLEGLQNLIKKNAGLVTAKSQRGRCALHVAVLVENPEIIEHLIRAKRDAVHVADNMGRTPLHYAMAMPHVTTIGQILVQNGASRTARDVKMRTPSYFFIYKQEIMKLKEEETAD